MLMSQLSVNESAESTALIKSVSILYTCTYTCTCIHVQGSVFNKLIWCTIGPKSFLHVFGTAQFSLWVSDAVNYDYISLTALTLS